MTASLAKPLAGTARCAGVGARACEAAWPALAMNASSSISDWASGPEPRSLLQRARRFWRRRTSSDIGRTQSPGALSPDGRGWSRSSSPISPICAIAKTKSYTKTDIRLTFVSSDDRITLQAYVESLKDHAVLNRTAIGANRSINASYAMLRTYGVKAATSSSLRAGRRLRDVDWHPPVLRHRQDADDDRGRR